MRKRATLLILICMVATMYQGCALRKAQDLSVEDHFKILRREIVMVSKLAVDYKVDGLITQDQYDKTEKVVLKVSKKYNDMLKLWETYEKFSQSEYKVLMDILASVMNELIGKVKNENG